MRLLEQVFSGEDTVRFRGMAIITRNCWLDAGSAGRCSGIAELCPDRRVLIALLVLPFYVPPVIFGAGIMQAAQGSTSPFQALAFLAAYALFALALGPIAMGAALRSALS